MFSFISGGPGLAAWFSGAAAGIGLFAVVGAQSAFILRQGILRKHIVPVVATCAAIDAVFIFASVAGLRTLTQALPWLTTVVLWGGVAFLSWYAWQSARRALAGG
ncbi:MAG: LysE/ArgO family amino acid transporter, partial [Stenotrophomonas sp.]